MNKITTIIASGIVSLVLLTSFISITNNDDEVAQIKKCKHIFTANQLNIWFQSNVKCPTCRYDIRNYIDEEEETNINNQTNNIEENNQSNNIELHTYDISNNEIIHGPFINFFDSYNY